MGRPIWELKREKAEEKARSEGYVLAVELLEKIKKYGVTIGAVYYWTKKMPEETKVFNGMIAVKRGGIVEKKIMTVHERDVYSRKRLSMERRKNEEDKSPYFSYEWMFSGRGRIYKTKSWIADELE